MYIMQLPPLLFLLFLHTKFASEAEAAPSDVSTQNKAQPEDAAAPEDRVTLRPELGLNPEVSGTSLPPRCDPPAASDSLHTMDPRGPRVLVIGAGISGLAAAQKLHTHGFHNLRVLEATGRSGGRIWTEKFAKGLVEIGAQWIHGPSPGNAVFNLSVQYNLLGPDALLEENQKVELRNHPGDIPAIYSSSGKRIDLELAQSVQELYSSWLDQSQQFIQNESIPDASVGGFIKQEIARCSQQWDKESGSVKMALLSALLKLECCINGAHSMDHVGLASFGEYKMLPGRDCTFPRGFESLVSAVKSSLPEDSVVLNKAVKTIQWNGSFQGSDSRLYPVQVQCEDGDAFLADHVIVTVPLGFLKAQAESFLQPPLPPHKVQAIKNIGFGTNNKLILEFEEPFWDPECHSIELVWDGESPLVEPQRDLRNDWVKKFCGFVVLKPPEQPGHVLCGFIAGEESEYMETLTDEEVLTTITTVLRQFTGNPKLPPPVRIRRSHWHSENYTRGSYSYLAVGSSGKDIDILAQPLPEERDSATPLQVLFAGEATHRSFFSTTHGAVMSGWREAERLIGQYPGLHPSLTKAKL